MHKQMQVVRRSAGDDHLSVARADSCADMNTQAICEMVVEKWCSSFRGKDDMKIQACTNAPGRDDRIHCCVVL